MVTARRLGLGVAMVLGGCSLTTPNAPPGYACDAGVCVALNAGSSGGATSSGGVASNGGSGSSGGTSHGTNNSSSSGAAASGGSTGASGTGGSTGSSSSSPGGSSIGGSSGGSTSVPSGSSSGGTSGGGSSGCPGTCTPACLCKGPGVCAGTMCAFPYSTCSNCNGACTNSCPDRTIGDDGGCEGLPQMPTPRYDFATVQVPDGRVFVIGGSDGGQATALVEVYSPSANTWDQSYPPLPEPAASIGGAVAQGTVLYVVGTGQDNNGVLIYPDVTVNDGVWQQGPSLDAGEQAAGVVGIDDGGLILAIAGYDRPQGSGSGTVAALDVASHNWSTASFPMVAQPWNGASAAADPAGNVYVVGTYSGTAYKLSAGASSWSTLAILGGRTALNGAATAIDQYGNFWVVGGWAVAGLYWSEGSDVVPDLFVAPPSGAGASIGAHAQLPIPRAGLGAFFGVAPDGKTYLYTLGGITDAGVVVGTVEAYSPDTGCW